jgi:hypothetical protein
VGNEGVEKMSAATKYHNQPVIIDGIKFASRSESMRYMELKTLKQARMIKDFELQPRFTLQPAFRKCPACHHIQAHVPGSKKKQDLYCQECGERLLLIKGIEYVADFRVINLDGTEKIEDVKGSFGYQTEIFKIKAKLFEARYPDKTIEIVVVQVPHKKKAAQIAPNEAIHFRRGRKR